jgi:diacylglycerol kinase
VSIDFDRQMNNLIFEDYGMKAFINRVKFAFNGWAKFFAKETNGQIQLLVAFLVIIAGFLLNISRGEWMIVLGCTALVLSLEMINSAIEKLCDHLHPGLHPQIGLVKDIAAGAVLWASVVSVAIGLIIFLPRIISLF